jgi:hypothetical protein
VASQLQAPATLATGKEPPPRYPLDRRLGGPRVGQDAVESIKNLTPAWNRTSPLSVSIPIELSRLPNNGEKAEIFT